MENRQQGPPDCGTNIAEVVSQVSYKPGWEITVEDMVRQHEHLEGGQGLTLVINIPSCPDSTQPHLTVGLTHFFAVPPAEYDHTTWERWVLDCIIQVETHEALEFFKVDGWAPYFPPHGNRNGRNPYTIERRQRT